MTTGKSGVKFVLSSMIRFNDISSWETNYIAMAYMAM